MIPTMNARLNDLHLRDLHAEAVHDRLLAQARQSRRTVPAPQAVAMPRAGFALASARSLLAALSAAAFGGTLG